MKTTMENTRELTDKLHTRLSTYGLTKEDWDMIEDSITGLGISISTHEDYSDALIEAVCRVYGEKGAEYVCEVAQNILSHNALQEIEDPEGRELDLLMRMVLVDKDKKPALREA